MSKYITRVDNLVSAEVLTINEQNEVEKQLVEVYGVTPKTKEFEKAVKSVCDELGVQYIKTIDSATNKDVKFRMEKQEFYKNSEKLYLAED